MSHKITRGCAPGVRLYPVSHKFIFWSQGPRLKEHIWRCASCWALPAGEASHSWCHTNCSAVAAGLRHTAGWAANTQCLHVFPPQGLTARRYLGPLQSIGRARKAEEHHRTTRETIHEFSSWNWGKHRGKKSPTPQTKSQQLSLSLHQDSGFFHCSSRPEGCAPSSHALSTNNTHANTAAIICPWMMRSTLDLLSASTKNLVLKIFLSVKHPLCFLRLMFALTDFLR